ncbi:telomeric repeat-binding factor 2-interacting protein 1 [Centropristis striata]|uniref:telomeric repeat-binding factor 2-interacting protein 1 n=1 Tax=Centropristis striata TaxID=184440 RepID=UPI0027E17B80|nr:telomeric repeat-binding factor 2-interacting protein 1 [Centropristis striata]
MPSKEDQISPVLFMTTDGEPMSFYLRPGPAKQNIAPLISAGGGMMCKVQQPGAILLIDPEEKSSIRETSGHWYVSTQFIHDCIEKEEQLDLEDYRITPEVAPRQSARLSNKRDSSGRTPYTAAEDKAILSHVSKHKAEVKGNRLWQQMEKLRVTNHSWQSMKYRYKVRLAKLQSEAEKKATAEKESEAAEEESDAAEEESKAAEEEAEVEENQETNVQKPSSTEDTASPPTHSAESDLTQIDDQSIPSDSKQPELTEAETSVSQEEEEVQHVNPQTDEQPAESPKAETVGAETSEGPCVEPQTDAPPDPAESAEQELDEPQTETSPEKESVPEASPEREQLRRRVSHRRLFKDPLSPEPSAKRFRSLKSSPQGYSPFPESSKTTNSALKSSPQNYKIVEQSPSKTARGKSAAHASRQDESEQAAVPETARAETESNSVPQKAEKKKEKRNLGILELATKEFEDESEISDEELTQDLQNPTETANIQPTSAEPPLPTSDTAAEAAVTQSSPEPEPSLQEDTQDILVSSSKSPPKIGGPEPAATEAVTASSKAHLFIFASETQEEDSESITADTPAAPSDPQLDKDAAPSLTQIQLEEDMQALRELMKQTKQDLVSVTKALLRTSGDFSAALDQLLNPSSSSGPVWTRQEDSLLFSADPVVRLQLQEKYGEEGVAKRIMFLEVEG